MPLIPAAATSADDRLVHVPRSVWLHRQLVAKLVWREVIGRYRGSMLGLLWSLVTPLIMLSVYTFVFGFVFSARWGPASGSRYDYALSLFAGLIVFGLFAECVNRAPTLVLENVNFVKKVVFPLEILPWITILAALFHASISLLLLILMSWAVHATVPPTVLLLPMVLLPHLLFTLGVTWFLAALGVYLRDVTQTVGILTSALMFASPIFYPLSALPEDLQPWFAVNPIAIAVEQARDVVLHGRLPNAIGWLAYFGTTIFVAWIGLAWFQKARRGFADVL